MKTTTKKFNPATAMNTEVILKYFAKKMVIGAGMILFCTGTFSARAVNYTVLKSLHSHVPKIAAQLTPKGIVSSNMPMRLAIGLPLRNTEELTNLLKEIYNPSSTNFHHYLTPAEFTEKFGPTEQDYQMVENFARVNGLTIEATHSNRMLLDVSGDASDVEKAFNVTLQIYKHPTENRDFFAPNVEPSVNSSLPILDVEGLDDFRIPHPKFEAKPLGAITNFTANNGSGPFNLYMGDDFRRAYVPGTILNGSGQTVALVQFDGYLASDINLYENMAGRTNVPLQNILIDGFSGVPTGTGGEGEVSLDIEMVVSMAPALSKIIVYEGNPGNFHPNDVLNRIATDNTAKQIGCSWGWGGGPQATTEQIFQEMALQGQTFFNASGDDDAFLPGEVDNPAYPGSPSSSPNITQVGGTTLTMNGSGVSYNSETVWNYSPDRDGIGSSGGISSYYSIPWWQTNINMVKRGGSQTMRNIPDVALTADNVLSIADGGIKYSTAGTSCAAPLWAGFMALVNQQATNNGVPPIGFLNPALYAIASSADYTNCFRDVTTGNNEWSASPNLFVATNGYDLCTGLGTPNGTNLINALTAVGVTNPVTHLSPPLPPYGTTLSALNGSNPNGTWQLFTFDDSPFNSGMISNGWILTLVTADPVGFSANLSLGMTASATNIVIGDTVTYTLTLTNCGPSAASNVVVADTLPVNAAAILSSQADVGTVLLNGQSLDWSVGNLATNAGSKLVVTIQPDEVSDNIFNYATASADTPDPNQGDNYASLMIAAVNLNPPLFSSVTTDGSGQFHLTVSSPSLLTIIQASTNLVDWVNIYTNTPPFTFTESNTTDYPNRFFRAVTQ